MYLCEWYNGSVGDRRCRLPERRRYYHRTDRLYTAISPPADFQGLVELDRLQEIGPLVFDVIAVDYRGDLPVEFVIIPFPARHAFEKKMGSVKVQRVALLLTTLQMKP